MHHLYLVHSRNYVCVPNRRLTPCSILHFQPFRYQIRGSQCARWNQTPVYESLRAEVQAMTVARMMDVARPPFLLHATAHQRRSLEPHTERLAEHPLPGGIFEPKCVKTQG